MIICRIFSVLSIMIPFAAFGKDIIVKSSSGQSLILDIRDFRAVKVQWRDYNQDVTEQEKEDLTYIVTTLGNKSLTKIYKEKENLKKAGDRIDHLHPLRFLRTVFTDEELKAAIANIKESRWVWGEFKKGLFNSLKDETRNKNMNIEFIKDFASSIDIDPALIIPSINESDWDNLITVLIKNVPREGNPTRYDM
jgi:hypothetical protein